jgi:hypothetical protein
MNSKFLVLSVAALMMSFMPAAQAQDACANQVARARRSEDWRMLKQLLDARQSPACVSELLLQRTRARVSDALLVAAYKKVTENIQQNGSSSGSGGSTNLVSKSLSSRVLSFASEYGALTESSSGQTTTISGSLDGIPLALEGHTSGLFSECPVNLIAGECIPSSLFDALGRFSYSVALNTTQASQLKGTATGQAKGTTQAVNVQSSGSAGTVSQITGKFVLMRTAVKGADLQDALKSLDSHSALQSADDAMNAAAKTLKSYQKNAGENPGEAWAKWRDSAFQHLSTVAIKDVVNEWHKQGDSLASVLENSGEEDKRPTEADVTQAALTFASAFAEFNAAERNFYTKMQKPILSFEYDENRPASQPSNSVFRFIYNQDAFGWTFTGNAAASIYDSTPSSSIPGAQRLRDIQLAFQGDHALPKFGILGTPTFSVSYYFQNQTSPAILNVNPSGPVSGVTFAGLSADAKQVYAQKGKISIGQLKISLGNSKSGLRVPLAITGSNRTELITKTKLGAQIGISYDFDSLFAK